MQSLRPLVADGRVRRVAVSNYSVAQWREAERALRAPVVANQVALQPGRTRARLLDLVPYASRTTAWWWRTRRWRRGSWPWTADWSTVKGFRRARRRARGTADFERLATAVREIAAAHDATPTQVALAWVLAHPNTIAIPGARTIEQLESNAAAADLVLADDEVARLSAEAQAFAGRR